jgi:hypothetical protein
MNWCHETAKMRVPARHREPARSGEAGRPLGSRRRIHETSGLVWNTICMFFFWVADQNGRFLN